MAGSSALIAVPYGGMTQTPIRPAATVMLVRDRVAGPEVYLLRRVSGLAFAGGMTAFPGGGVDPRDSVALGWSGPGVDWWAAAFGVDAALAGSVLVAAARELFEETGVLLADLPASAPATDPAVRERLRVEVTEHRIGLDAVLAGSGGPVGSSGPAESSGAGTDGTVRTDLLRPWARWVTPPGQPRRYDTFFLLAQLPAAAPDRAAQQPRMLTTEAEIGEWRRPQDALDAAGRGEIAMLPPTVAMLTELAGFGDTAGMLASERTVRRTEAMLVSGPDEPLRVRAGEQEYSSLGMPISRS
jgi:8-oxo-dGTP pyrophosphatase MutT (NUDIX family)